MNIREIIAKKKANQSLSNEEINYFVTAYTNGEIPDYQMSALLMAIYFNNMDKAETAALTKAIVESGDQIDLSGIHGVKVDKHSTGGVGDKISMIVIPIVASLGIPVAKMSGRGLGHTGGTIDKLESIPGFRVELTGEEFISNVNQYKMAIVGQSGNMTPADKKIYALRDVTETVDSIPLIASSIMGKKIASGSDAIVLDVKVGSGAFMKTIEQARALAKAMVDIGTSLGRKTVALLTNMDQPLGHEVGNANEVREAIEVLKGKGAIDETTVAIEISANMAYLGGAYESINTAREAVKEVIENGKALSFLKTFISIQGGDASVVDDPLLLPQAREHIEVRSTQSGYVQRMEAERIGHAAMLLGAGRRTKEDHIDYSAGITICKKIGDAVAVGDVLYIMHTNKSSVDEAYHMLQQAMDISDQKVSPGAFIHDIVR